MDDSAVIRHDLSNAARTLRYMGRKIRKGEAPSNEELALDVETVAAQIEGTLEVLRLTMRADLVPMGLANLPFTVLWLDDDIDTFEEAILRLQRAGITTLTAKTIQEAEAHLDRADGAILDLRLKDENGLTFLKAIRKRKPNVPVLVLSSYAEEPTLQRRAIELGAIGVMMKGSDLLLAHNVRRYFENEIVAKRAAEALESKAEEMSQFLASWKRERVAIGDQDMVAKIDEQMGLLQAELSKKNGNPTTVVTIIKAIQNIAENTAGSLIASGILARITGVFGA